ncbi:TPA: DNA primase, partial [Escherichia coli]|nr:DNA primase [Escherichia coli]HCO5470539.1 DNA primase [Escherichia coli]HCO5475999.1 DNA primase [Escherichia coli]
MKLAPNVKKQPRGIKNKDTEVIIFAGSDAWSHAQQWQEKDGPASGDNVPPVWLGPNQLAELDALKIVPDGKKRVRLYQAGELDLVEIKKIGQKLAAADIQDANFYPEGMHGQKCENWRRYLNVERQNLSADLVIKLPVKKKATTSPGDDELKPRVESRADGVFWVTPKVDKQSGEIIRPETWLCSPLELLGTGTIGKEHYRVMRWKKPANHEVITMAIPCGGIGDRDGWRLLKDHGLNVTTNGKYRAILA